MYMRTWKARLEAPVTRVNEKACPEAHTARRVASSPIFSSLTTTSPSSYPDYFSTRQNVLITKAHTNLWPRRCRDGRHTCRSLNAECAAARTALPRGHAVCGWNTASQHDCKESLGYEHAEETADPTICT